MEDLNLSVGPVRADAKRLRGKAPHTMLVIGWLAIILPDDQAQALVAELRRLTMWGAPLAWKVTAFNHLGTIEFDSEPFVPCAGEIVVPHDEQDSPAADQFPYVVRACDLIKKDVALPME